MRREHALEDRAHNERGFEIATLEARTARKVGPIRDHPILLLADWPYW
jgi:hypothetical protein